MKIIQMAVTVWVVVCALVIQDAQAGVSLGQTRLVFPQSESTRTITLYNSGSEAYLVQAAVTDWATNQPVKAFTVLPPLFRLEGNSSNVMRVVRTGGDFPQDRESVFHFRVNAIPAGKSPGAEGRSSLAISLGMGIKLFYRPDGLPMTPTEAYGKLTFQREGKEVEVNNPTPYYLTFARLSLGGTSVNLDSSPAMVPPFSRQRYPSASGDRAEWVVITDYGGNSDTFHATVK